LIYQNVTADVVPAVVDSTYVLYNAYEVYMKTSEPTITKTVSTNSSDGVSAGLYRAFGYNIEVTVPTFPEGATNKTFFVKDILPAGVSIDPGSIYVYATSTNQGQVTLDNSVYTITSNDSDYDSIIYGDSAILYIDFDYDSIKEYSSISITVPAFINENASVNEANTNTAELIYANSPFVGTTYDPTGDEDRPDENTPGYGVVTDTADVYTYGAVIHKTDSETGEALEGAVFGIYDTQYCSDNDLIATITTDENGYASFVGLKAATYYLKEISAPAGYTISDEVTEFEVSTKNLTSYYTTTTTVTYTSDYKESIYYISEPYNLDGFQSKDSDGNLLYLDASGNVTTTNTGVIAYTKSYETTVTPATSTTTDASQFLTIEVTNTAGKSLPGTGGIGVVPFIAVGSVLMIGAVVVLVTRKRMRDVEQG
jgi:fimbrial isopeptide formation D2 family protein/LPXTG-motif cell wall-anchored protein